MSRSKPDPGLVNVYAVNVGSSGAARVAYGISQAAAELDDLIKHAKRLGKIGRRASYLWP